MQLLGHEAGSLSRLHKLTAFMVMAILRYRGTKLAFRMHNMFPYGISPYSIHCGDYKIALTGKFSFHHVCIWRVRGAFHNHEKYIGRLVMCQIGAMNGTGHSEVHLRDRCKS